MYILPLSMKPYGIAGKRARGVNNMSIFLSIPASLKVSHGSVLQDHPFNYKNTGKNLLMEGEIKGRLKEKPKHW